MRWSVVCLVCPTWHRILHHSIWVVQMLPQFSHVADVMVVFQFFIRQRHSVKQNKITFCMCVWIAWFGLIFISTLRQPVGRRDFNEGDTRSLITSFLSWLCTLSDCCSPTSFVSMSTSCSYTVDYHPQYGFYRNILMGQNISLPIFSSFFSSLFILSFFVFDCLFSHDIQPVLYIHTSRYPMQLSNCLFIVQASALYSSVKYLHNLIILI